MELINNNTWRFGERKDVSSQFESVVQFYAGTKVNSDMVILSTFSVSTEHFSKLFTGFLQF